MREKGGGSGSVGEGEGGEGKSVKRRRRREEKSRREEREEKKKKKEFCGGVGHRSPCLSHAKRALYHLSYTPFPFFFFSLVDFPPKPDHYETMHGIIIIIFLFFLFFFSFFLSLFLFLL